MYEEMTYANIMAEMMADLPDGVDTSEGSLLWNACSKMAAAEEEFYSALSDVYDNMEVDTQDLDHLITGGAENGCPIIEATSAVMKAQFNMALPIGTAMEALDEDYTYTVTTLVDDTNHIYLITADDAGTEPNSYFGDIEPTEYVEGFENGTITAISTAGTDQEDEEVYRKRRIEFYSVKPFAGNIAYYKTEVDAMNGVGGCKPSRVSAGNVKIVIIGSDYKAPSAEIVAAVQKAVDPESSGDGEGIAPIGASVTVSGVTGETVNITAKITFSSGISYSDVQSYIEAAIDAYFVELGKSWEASATNLVVRVSQIEIRLLEISGITDVENITLNGTAANLTLGDNVIPVRGTFTCS